MCRKRPGGFSVAFSMHQIYGTGSMPRMHAPDLCPGVFFRALARRFKFLNDGSWRRIPKIPFCGQTTDKCGFFINPTFFDPCAHFLCGIFFVNYFPTPPRDPNIPYHAPHLPMREMQILPNFRKNNTLPLAPTTLFGILFKFFTPRQ